MAQEYPLPRFYFEVTWGRTQISCTEVTGLVMEREKIEYRHSDSSDFSKIVMPGMIKHSNITIKRGTFEGKSEFSFWFKDVTKNKSKRYDLLISLVNENKTPAVKWKAMGCFVVKMTGADLKSDASEVAIESIEVAHEGLTVMD